MGDVTQLYIRRPGLVRGEGVPRCVEIDETVELLIRALKASYRPQTIWGVREFEVRHGRQLADLARTKVLAILTHSRSMAPGAFSWQWAEDQRPESKAVTCVANNVTRDLYQLRHRSEVGMAQTEAKAWFRRLGQRRFQAEIYNQRWSAYTLEIPGPEPAA